MFGSFLLVLKQFGCQRFVSGIIPSEWPRSSDGEALHVAPDLPSQHLRARPDDFPIAKLEVVHVGRRVDPPQRLVEPKERALERNLESLRQNYLEDISGFNVVFGLSDSFAEILLAYIRLRLADLCRSRISAWFLEARMIFWGSNPRNVYLVRRRGPSTDSRMKHVLDLFLMDAKTSIGCFLVSRRR